MHVYKLYKRIRLVTFAISIFFLMANSSYAQQWVNTFDGTANTDDRVRAAVCDASGNVYVTGYVTNLVTGTDICTIKYNSAGLLQWVRFYNGPGNGDDRAFGISIDNVGNVYVTGYSTGTTTQTDFTTIKYNSVGIQQWVARYNGSGNGEDRAFGIAVDRVGNAYVTGFVTRGGTDKDIYTIQYSPSGSLLWSHYYNGSNGNGDDEATAITLDTLQTHVYITGYASNSGTGFDLTTICYDVDGSRDWVSTYTGSGNNDDRAFGLVTDNGGKYVYVVGYTTSSANGSDYVIVKYHAIDGDSSWTAKYNGIGGVSDKAFGIVSDRLGNIYVTGLSTGNNSMSDYVTIKYTSSGVRSWVARYDGTGQARDTAYALVLNQAQNNLFVTGSSQNANNSGTEDMVTIKYDVSNGNQLQLSRINGQNNRSDAGLAIAVDASDNVFAAGYMGSNLTGFDMLAAKFERGELIGINLISSEVPKNFELQQNYPNPFNPSTNIKFDVSKSSLVKLTVYDVTGRQIAVLVNEFLKVGSYEVDFSIPAVSSDVYFYELAAGSYRQTRKMVLLK
jgi:type IX secretion system substrate protein/beta-propeller repeat-containing protein